MAEIDADAPSGQMDAEERENRAPTDKEELFRWLVEMVRRDRSKVREWQDEARDDYRFYAGDQWEEEDAAALQKQKRAAPVYNQSKKLVDAVVGAEINNRREVRFIPREAGDEKASEVLTGAVEYMRDECDAEDEETDAFRDCVIAGMGWTETRLDMESSEDGEAQTRIERVNPFQMVWDRDAEKSNLVDAHHVARAKEMAIERAAAMFPEASRGELHAAWWIGLDSEGGESSAGTRDPREMYEGDDDGGSRRDRKSVTIVEVQWLEPETFFRLPDPRVLQQQAMQVAQARAMGQMLPPAVPPPLVDVSEVQLEALKKAGHISEDTPVHEAKRQKCMRAFIGAKVLEVGPAPCGTHFSYECITGYFDQDKGRWFGMMRPAKDPQRWANKFLSQTMHIINASAKGGLLIETDAVGGDIRELEEKWAQPGGIITVKPGANTNGKVKERSQTPFPAGLFQLMQYSIDAIRDSAGVNLELLGQREATQPGVLEYQRRQAGMTLLATFFNALRRYRKRQGRIMLYLIQHYLADGRLVRIIGQERAQWVPLTKKEVAAPGYDIIVDDAPAAPNEAEKNWQIMQPLLPMIVKSGDPAALELVIDLAPLPASIKEKARAALQQAQQQAAQAQQAQQQLAAQQAQTDMAKTASETRENDAQTQKIQAEAAKTVLDGFLAVSQPRQPANVNGGMQPPRRMVN